MRTSIKKSDLVALVTTINNELQNQEKQDRLFLTNERNKFWVQRITPSTTFAKCDKVYISFGESPIRSLNYLTGFLHALTF